MLARGRLSGTKIALIIDIHTIGNGLEAPFCGKSLHYLEKLVFAVKAPLAIIADVFRSVHFAGLDHFNSDPMFMGEGERILQLRASQAGRVCDYRQHILAQDLARAPSQIGRIDPTGVGDKGAAERPERVFQKALLGGQIHY